MSAPVRERVFEMSVEMSDMSERNYCSRGLKEKKRNRKQCACPNIQGWMLQDLLQALTHLSEAEVNVAPLIIELQETVLGEQNKPTFS